MPKSLRYRVLLLFAVLAVGPLLALGVLDYVRARHAVERIVLEQTDQRAKRAAQLLLDRYALVESDAILLGDNAETQRLLAALPSGDAARIAAARIQVDTFVKTIWANARHAYRSIELRDERGAVLLRMAADSPSTGDVRDAGLPPFERPIVPSAGGKTTGTVVLEPLGPTMLPSSLGALSFGRSGYLLIVDSAARHVVYDSREPAAGMSATSVSVLLAERITALGTAQSASLQYMEHDSVRIASVERVAGAGWTVLSAAALPEFTSGLADARLRDLALVVAIAIAAALVFIVLMGRVTRPLEELTRAAGAVGQGDLSPQLPAASDDEVGTLSGAFDHMLQRVRSMMLEIEVSRQLAVLGEFSAQLSHEIRNPLTSLKLNLQGLARDVRRRSLPERASLPLETCLREVNRLDHVVRGVLELAKPRSTERQSCNIHPLVKRVLDLHAAQLKENDIFVIRELFADRDAVCGDEEQLVSLVTNLVINAIEAQPNGGHLLVRTRVDGANLEVMLADDGAGVSAEIAGRIFRPFVSDKPSGTGLGLAMALNVARDHGGALSLTLAPDGYSGACFLVKLPLS